jgi:hypothetical protein
MRASAILIIKVNTSAPICIDTVKYKYTIKEKIQKGIDTDKQTNK